MMTTDVPHKCITVRRRGRVLEVARAEGHASRPQVTLAMMRWALESAPDGVSSDSSDSLEAGPWIDVSMEDVGLPDRPFSISASRENAAFLLPDPYSVAWPEVGVPDVLRTCAEIDAAGRALPLSERDPRAFWVGADMHPSRGAICEASVVHPDRLDASLMAWCCNRVVSGRFTSLVDHTRYRYLIDVQGNGWSARLKYLMFSHRPLLVLDRRWWDWATVGIEPWVHYIPVLEDGSDLVERIAWADEHPEEAQAIAERAFEYVTGKLTLDNIGRAFLDALRDGGGVGGPAQNVGAIQQPTSCTT